MKGWEVRTLKEVCEQITDGTHQTPTYFEKGYIFLSSKNVTSGLVDWDKTKFIDEIQHKAMQKRVSPKMGDILLAKNGTTGIAALVDREINFDIYVSLAMLRPKKLIDPRFLLYFVNSSLAKAQFNKRIKGVGVPNLHLEEIREVTLNFPTCVIEQRRIVAILDEAFAGLATMRAHAEANLKNARALFDRYLNAIFSQKGEGWVKGPLKKLVGVVSTGPFGSLLHKSDYVSNGIPLVNPAHIVDGRIVPDLQKTISTEVMKRLSSYELKTRDIVIGRRGEIGRCAVVTEIENGWLCGTGSFYIRPSKSVNSFFIAHLLRSQIYREKLEILSTGATMHNLSNTALGDLVISIPNVAVQDAVLSEADLISEQVSALESLYRAKLAAIDELKQSILHQAFSGALSAKDSLAA